MSQLTEKDREEMAKRKERRVKRRVKKRAKKTSKTMKARQREKSASQKEAERQRIIEGKRKQHWKGELDAESPIVQELANRELCKRHLLPYVQRFNPDYLAGWVHKDICNRLERFFHLVQRRKSPRIMLMVPPRHGKSTLSSIEFPSWALGNDPNIEIILASYALPLASGFSRQVRDRVQYEPEYQLIFPETQISPDSRGIEEWRIRRPYKGRFQAAGVGGPITGKGADIFVIDDPVKNREEADSIIVQQSTWNWYTSTGYTRLSPGGGVIQILCMTGDTQVSMADGSYKFLEDVRPGDNVWAWKEEHPVPRKVLNWTPQGEDDVYEIKTGNSTVRANGKHPFLVRSSKGHYKWVRVEDIPKMGVNNCLVQSGLLPLQEKEPTVDEDEAWLLGYMFGDGWLTERKAWNYDKVRDKYYPRRGWVTCCAVSNHESENSFVLSLFSELFGCEPKRSKYGYIRTERQDIGKWFAEHGLIGKAKTKRLPKWLFSEPLDIRLQFLEGFVSADGCVRGEKKRVSITLCNYDLVQDIRHLARGCGYKVSNVHTHYGRGQPPNSPEPINYESHNIQWQVERSEEPFYFRRIRSIKYIGKEPVYDLQVEDAECFLADGLVSHNTRWHEQDLAGKSIDNARKSGEEWDIIRYSAIAEDVEYYDTKRRIIHVGEPEQLPDHYKKLRDAGDPLHPARYDAKALHRIKETVGPRDWSALYQQRPVAEEGDYIRKKWFRYYTPMSYDGMKHIQAWDLAIGKNDQNNYTVGITIALDWDGRVHLREAIRGRWGTHEIAEQVLRKHIEYDSELVGIEHGHIFLAVEEDLRKLEKRYRVRPTYDDTLKPIHDKHVRARPMQGMFQGGNIIFPEDVMSRWPWLIEELLKFPALGRDDGFDALAWACRMLPNVALPRRGPHTTKAQSWKDQLKQYKAGANNGGNHLLA